jgi:hypothetical protein
MVQSRVSGIFSRMKPRKARSVRIGRAVLRGCAAALACFSLGCSGDAEPDPAEQSAHMWFGEVQDSDVKVGLAEQDGTVTLFFCGGDTSYTTDTHWFADRALLSEPFSFSEDGWSVDGAMKNGILSGSVQSAVAESREWTAAPADSTTLAGLYVGAAPCGKLGLIVSQSRQDAEATGQGACLRVEGETAVVEQVNPVRLELSATRELQVSVASAPDELFTVRPVVSVAQ